MSDGDEQTLFTHIEALRRTLLQCLGALLICFPAGYLLAPYCITWLIKWCCPPELGAMNYFAPMEVFVIQLKLALILAAAIGFPFCAWRIWGFLLPALYSAERRALKWWIAWATLLFLSGAAFCVLTIMPLVMRFAAGFAGEQVRPMLGLGNFLEMTGWMALAFGLMFQFPLAVMLAVRFGLVSVETLRAGRPYVVVAIAVLAAVLTPPDVLSQLLLGIPSWLLFEIGLFFAAHSRRRGASGAEEPNVVTGKDDDDKMADFYRDEENK